MTRIVAILALLVSNIGFGQEKLQEFNVSGVQCQHVAERVSRWLVEKEASKYIDSCVQWSGVVATIADADVDGIKVWVVPVEGRFAYCGTTRLTISFYGTTGTDMLSSFATFPPFEYLCTHRTADIQRGAAVSFVGKILGVSKRPDPDHHGQALERILIGITEIHKLDHGAEVKSPRWPADQ